jgi:hypothetical protein
MIALLILLMVGGHIFSTVYPGMGDSQANWTRAGYSVSGFL